MFKELYALTERAPVLLLLSREGEKLRVNLTRKQDEDEKDPAISLSILATPAELDSELPLALAEGLAMTEAPAATPTVADQVKAQVAAAKQDESTPAKKATVRKPAAKPAATAKKVSSKPAAAKSATKRARKAKAVLVPDAALAAITGAGVEGQNQAMAKVWAYIKAHGCKEKRHIVADEKLAAVLDGKKKIAVPDLAKCVKKHLVAAVEAIEAGGVAPPVISPLIKSMADPPAEAPRPEQPAAAEEPASATNPSPAAGESPTADREPEPQPVTPPAEPGPSAPAALQEPAAIAAPPASPVTAQDASSLDLFS